MRQDILNQSMLAPGETEIAPGVKMRKISLASLSMLARIGSPLASVDTAAKAGNEISISDIAEFLYIHAAPLEEVRQTVYRSRAALAEKADEFCAAIPPDKIPAILSALAGDAQAVRLAQASALPDPSLPPSKNGQSPAE
ncbi:MAG: hypothetical protein J6L64_01500 [Opitutales bacterium]|nr:hypothetical protein [Opitutales bacterium]